MSIQASEKPTIADIIKNLSIYNSSDWQKIAANSDYSEKDLQDLYLAIAETDKTAADDFILQCLLVSNKDLIGTLSTDLPQRFNFLKTAKIASNVILESAIRQNTPISEINKIIKFLNDSNKKELNGALKNPQVLNYLLKNLSLDSPLDEILDYLSVDEILQQSKIFIEAIKNKEFIIVHNFIRLGLNLNDEHLQKQALTAAKDPQMAQLLLRQIKKVNSSFTIDADLPFITKVIYKIDQSKYPLIFARLRNNLLNLNLKANIYLADDAEKVAEKKSDIDYRDRIIRKELSLFENSKGPYLNTQAYITDKHMFVKEIYESLSPSAPVEDQSQLIEREHIIKLKQQLEEKIQSQITKFKQHHFHVNLEAICENLILPKQNIERPPSQAGGFSDPYATVLLEWEEYTKRLDRLIIDSSASAFPSAPPGIEEDVKTQVTHIRDDKAEADEAPKQPITAGDSPTLLITNNNPGIGKTELPSPIVKLLQEIAAGFKPKMTSAYDRLCLELDSFDFSKDTIIQMFSEIYNRDRWETEAILFYHAEQNFEATPEQIFDVCEKIARAYKKDIAQIIELIANEYDFDENTYREVQIVQMQPQILEDYKKLRGESPTRKTSEDAVNNIVQRYGVDGGAVRKILNLRVEEPSSTGEETPTEAVSTQDPHVQSDAKLTYKEDTSTTPSPKGKQERSELIGKAIGDVEQILKSLNKGLTDNGHAALSLEEFLTELAKKGPVSDTKASRRSSATAPLTASGIGYFKSPSHYTRHRGISHEDVNATPEPPVNG